MDADITAVKKKSQVLLEKSWAKIESDFKPKTLSSGCILYGYDMVTSYRKRGLKI